MTMHTAFNLSNHLDKLLVSKTERTFAGFVDWVDSSKETHEKYTKNDKERIAANIGNDRNMDTIRKY